MRYSMPSLNRFEQHFQKMRTKLSKKRSIKRFEKCFQVHPLTGCFMTKNSLEYHCKLILGALNRRKILFPFLVTNVESFVQIKNASIEKTKETAIIE